MKENRDWDFFRNTQRKIAYHPKCQRCSRNCKQSWRVKTLICPGFARFGDRRRKYEFCPCGGGDFTPFRE